MTTGLTTTFRCLRALNINDTGRRVEVMCEDWQVFPRSHTSEFCVATNADPRDRLLERDAGELVQASDAFALSLKQPKKEMGEATLIIPVIVTSAPIYTARYDPSFVSLESGEFVKPPAEITQPPCVRFHKTFPSDSSFDLGSRTVFVVTADALGVFLSNVQPVPMGQQSEERRNGVFLHRPERRRFL
jgi:hypothetical protein